MKRSILTLSILLISVLVFGQTQSPPLPDSVKIAVIFKNEKDINQYLTNLQAANNGVINSVMPSADAQRISQLIFSVIQYMQQNWSMLNPPKAPVIPKEDPKNRQKIK